MPILRKWLPEDGGGRAPRASSAGHEMADIESLAPERQWIARALTQTSDVSAGDSEEATTSPSSGPGHLSVENLRRHSYRSILNEQPRR